MKKRKATAAPKAVGRVLRVPEVTQLLGVRRETLWSWRRRGLFVKAVKLGPNTIGFREDDVREWLATRPAA